MEEKYKEIAEVKVQSQRDKVAAQQTHSNTKIQVVCYGKCNLTGLYNVRATPKARRYYDAL